METKLNNTLKEIIGNQDVQGIVVADKQGLCLGARGVASEESSGLWTALLTEASKLEPHLPMPTAILENNKKQCLVQGNEKLVIALYKDR